MSIFDEARRGELLDDKVSRLDSTSLNSQDPRTGFTLLAIAVLSGVPAQVEQLLQRGAKVEQRCKNEETPLLLATWQAKFERPLIVKTLLAYLEDKESLNHTCRLAGGNTPIMWAVERADADSVRLLAEAGAKIQNPKNEDGEKAEDIALRIGKPSLIECLRPAEEKTFLSNVAKGVAWFGRHIASWVDDKFSGFMSKVFQFKGEKVDSTEARMREMRTSPAEPTAEEFVEIVDQYVKSSPALRTFFKDDKQFMQDIAAKLVNLAKSTASHLASPELLPKTLEVTMHQQVLYCDDSTSMKNDKGRKEKRWENQKDLARHIAELATLILPDDLGVALRFINQPAPNESVTLDLEGLEKGFQSISPRGDTPIGTMLHERILKPLVLEPLAKRRFKRPLLVSILTDGGPSGEKPGTTLAKVILDCGDYLDSKNYPRDCVKFLIGQVGSSVDAVEFLDTLNSNPDIRKVTHVFAGRFDDRFKSFRDPKARDRWLIKTLFQPLANAARAGA